MPLDIRELFISDLDPNNVNWWSEDKLDKLNHNFRQLTLGGPQGPVGKTGFSGQPGARGFQGFIGIDGLKGFQGFQGGEGSQPWNWVDNRTLIPKFNGTIEYVAKPVVFGKSSLTASPTPYSGAPLILQASAEPLVNLELKANEIDIELGVIFDLNSNGAASALHIKGNPLTPSIRKNFKTDEFALIATSDVLRINQTGFKVNSNVVFDDTVDITELRYDNGAIPGYILAADNATGDTSWRYKYDLFDALPVGSIVSIQQSEFNSTNFSLDTTITPESAFIQMDYGRGKTGTKFEGWYLCNGETWHTDGIVQYSVPNLNSFTYYIESNGQGQTLEIKSDSTPIFIGGANLRIDSSFNSSPSSYDSTLSTDVLDKDITVEFNTGNVSYQQSKNVHIVYLGINDLVWQTTIIPTVTESIDLLGPSSSFEVACLDSTLTQFLWTGIGLDWTDLNEDMTGVKLYTTASQPAVPNMWYAKGGVARYWNGTAFISYIDCPVQTTIELVYDLDVTELNGTVTNGTNHAINNIDFSQATTLLDSLGDPVPSGWYKQVTGDQYGVRRYWDGSDFAGSSINTEFVTYLGQVEGSLYFDSNACTNTEGLFKVYNSTNNTITSTNPVSDIYNTSGTVLVHLNWTLANTGEHPLKEIYLQNRPGSSNPYRSLVDLVERASIKIDSTLQQPVTC